MNRKSLIFVLASLLTLVLAAPGLSAQSNADRSDAADRFGRKLRTINSIVKELHTSYVDTLNAEDLMDRTINSLLYMIDPYTTYYPADNRDELLALSEGSYAGIGSMISKQGDKIVISGPYWDSPARTTGLRYGDVIVAVDGDTVKADTDISSVSHRLRGQAGTVVHVDIARPYVGPDSLMSFDIVRSDIPSVAMPYYSVLPDSIGFISLSQFSESAGRDVKRAVSEIITAPGLKGIILDLRGNGGGLLEGAVQVASIFVPKGTEILRTRGRVEPERIYKTTTRPIAADVPLVILVDEGTASSSEIVAGSMQDLDRAVIMGERSFGKGLVQSSRPLPFDELLKITTARYYIPSGRLIQALNYAERNDDGTPTRMPDSLTSEFRTAAGRIVRDGGGITPDSIVKSNAISRLSQRLYTENLLFNFANKVYNTNPDTPAEDAVLVDSVLFDRFKNFVEQSGFNYDRSADRLIALLREAVEYEGYNSEEVGASIAALEDVLHHDLDFDLELNKDELLLLLNNEIGSRYFPDSVVINRSINSTDSVAAAARALLRNPEAYRAILRGQ